jgi:cysteinyl-tRNA synthetase
MDDDFNTPGALAALFDLLRAINTARDASVGGAPFAAAQTTMHELAGVLGLRLEEPHANATPREADPFIELLLEVRTATRQAKQYHLADMIRDRLAALGVTLEDTPQGTRWKYEQ